MQGAPVSSAAASAAQKAFCCVAGRSRRTPAPARSQAQAAAQGAAGRQRRRLVSARELSSRWWKLGAVRTWQRPVHRQGVAAVRRYCARSLQQRAACAGSQRGVALARRQVYRFAARWWRRARRRALTWQRGRRRWRSEGARCASSCCPDVAGTVALTEANAAVTGASAGAQSSWARSRRCRSACWIASQRSAPAQLVRGGRVTQPATALGAALRVTGPAVRSWSCAQLRRGRAPCLAAWRLRQARQRGPGLCLPQRMGPGGMALMIAAQMARQAMAPKAMPHWTAAAVAARRPPWPSRAVRMLCASPQPLRVPRRARACAPCRGRLVGGRSWRAAPRPGPSSRLCGVGARRAAARHRGLLTCCWRQPLGWQPVWCTVVATMFRARRSRCGWGWGCVCRHGMLPVLLSWPARAFNSRVG